MFSPAVLTSRRADDHFAKIKGEHTDMLKNMALQKMKVDQYNMQKQAELQQENTMRGEMDKAKLVAKTTSEKNHLDFAAKQAEIDVKRTALSSMD